MKYLKLTVILFMLTFANSFTQKGKEKILESYPMWTTNFEKSLIKLDELISGGPPKDGIPAIVNPKFTTQEEATDWLNEKEPVIAVNLNGISKAYPLQILIFHEIVNDRVGRTPILITFCPLCYSGIVFDRTVNNMSVRFGVSGLLRNSDMVMYDQLTESFWQQFSGEAVVGDLTGAKLKVIPSQIISFQQFKNNYPDGLVLSKNTGFKRPYGMNPYLNYDNAESNPFLFNGENDNRLPQNEKVIGIKLDSIAKAYPYSITSQQKVINDTIDSVSIVLFHLPGTLSSLDERYIEDSKDVGSTGAFNRRLGNETYSFLFEDGKIKDQQTGSVWSITGKCTEGKLSGKQLSKIPHGDYFSFAWFAFQPNTILFSNIN